MKGLTNTCGFGLRVFRGISYSSLLVASLFPHFAGSIAAASGLGGFVSKDGAPKDALLFTSQWYEYRCFSGGMGGFDIRETNDTAWFSSDTPSGPDLKVRIENTTGVFRDIPYSDRGYSSANRSERINFARSNRHKKRTLSVWTEEGTGDVNTFSFQIYKKGTDEVVDSGTFAVTVQHQWLPTRVIYNDPQYCRDPAPPLPPLPPLPVPGR
jgi:hypothetical protein